MSARVNYDAIAHLYDEPLRDHAVDPNLQAFLRERPDLHPATIRIQDMGCGTGKQLAANHHDYPHMFMIGLDASMGMLLQAKTRCPDVTWLQASSANSPFKTGSFDYIINQFSYAHVPAKPLMIVETYRLLKVGGRFIMINIDPWLMRNWYLYRHFSAAQPRDFADFLPAEDFVTAMTDAGFSDIQVNRAYQPVKEDLRHAFDYVSQRFRSSQLMAISDQEYAAGLAALEADMKNGTADSEFCLVTISGDKAG